jgi:hypothetical protein
VTYEREKLDGDRGEKPAAVDETWEYQLAGVSRPGYATFPVEVDAAIDRGVAYLRKLQKPDGNFPPHGGYDMGTTALAAYTLVSCGVPATDAAIEAALSCVFSSDSVKTYEQAVGLMAVERAFTPPGELASRPGEERRVVRELPASRRAWCELTAAALEKGAGSPGSWGYPPGPNAIVKFDTSNTQYAVLGLQAAARLGYAVKESTWLGVLRHFAQMREAEGPRANVTLLRVGQAVTEAVPPTPVAKAAGFRYDSNDRRVWASMTCAGIASLSIARHELRQTKTTKLGAKQEDEADAMILGAWSWLDRHWGTDRHPEKPGRDWYYYFLYSLERAAILDSVQRVGGRDWYFEGAVQLLARQKGDGSWDEPGGVDTTETCFALLFLKRATAALTPGK